LTVAYVSNFGTTESFDQTQLLRFKFDVDIEGDGGLRRIKLDIKCQSVIDACHFSTYDQVAKLFVHNFPEVLRGSDVAIVASVSL
jgi:hypothetical protein